MDTQRPSIDGPRGLAHLIDETILLVPTAVVFALYGGVTLAALVMTWAVRFAYYFVQEATTGQTVGKRMKGLRVVRADGTAASASTRRS